MGNELSLPYVPIDPNIETHPKTRRFLRAVGKGADSTAYLHLVQFLLTVGKHHVSGKLGVMSDEDIADMGRWPGDAKQFTEALVSSGWLMIGEGGFVVVGWEDYGGRVLQKREEWRERQKRRRTTAKVPEPVTEMSRDVTETKRESRDVSDHKVKGEGEGEVREKTLAPSAPHSPPPLAIMTQGVAVPVLPLTGDKVFAPLIEDIRHWESAFPAVDVMQALRAMRAWCDANPTQRKTPRGIKAFVVRWLSREQDRGRPRNNGHGPPVTVSRQQASFEADQATVEAFNASRRTSTDTPVVPKRDQGVTGALPERGGVEHHDRGVVAASFPLPGTGGSGGLP